MSSVQTGDSGPSTPPPPPGIDIVEVTGNSIGNLAYTTKLIIRRTAGLVGGPLLPERPPVMEVRAEADNRLSIVIHDQLHDELRSLLADTPLGRQMSDLYNRCYQDLYGVDRKPVSATHELQLTVEQSAQLSQALILLLLNYSNTPLSSLIKRT